ncbi:MAG TPA: clostripain-related cysteine peptidase [Fimbriimonadaceae bacterium]|nr:clostripain-related cysteine peptidase [Fimbriimonadaceae bacterium]
MTLPLRIVGLLGFLLIVCGCGGGGGSTPLSQLIYSTDWTRMTSAGGGRSQRVSLYDGNGRLAKTVLAEVGAGGRQSYNLNDVPSGTYRLLIELYSQPTLGGVLVGRVSDYVTLSGTSTYETVVGESVQSVTVSPSQVVIPVPQSSLLLARGLSATGVPTFTDPATITWQALGGVATVDGSGRVTATTAGSGSVRATHVPSGRQGSSSVQVQPFAPTTSKWTVLVFMNAANDLYSFSTLNMNQMERVAGNPDVRFVVQWKQTTGRYPASTFDGTRRYLVQPDQSNGIASQLVQDLGSSVDMGRPQALNNFVSWAKTYYPAERYCLVVWNHGGGWRRGARDQSTPYAVSYDDETGNAIQTWELRTALNGHHFDILAWDCSLMQMMEVVYECRDFADLIVGSEESPPGEGYPYDRVFAPFRDQPDETSVNLSRNFVTGMLAVPEYANRKITQSVFDASKVPNLASKIDTLAAALIANNSSLTATVPAIRSNSKSYGQTNVRYYRDLDDVCQRLISGAGIPAVVNAATQVRGALAQARIWEGHNANSAGSNGVSIDFSPSAVYVGAAADYARVQFAIDTRWDDWLAIAP